MREVTLETNWEYEEHHKDRVKLLNSGDKTIILILILIIITITITITMITNLLAMMKE